MSRRLLLGIFSGSFAIVMIAGAFAYRTFYDVHHLLIVHFDAFRGIDFLGTRRDVFGVALTAFAVVVVNGLLALTLEKRWRFLAATIAYATAVFAIIVLLAMSIIIANN